MSTPHFFTPEEANRILNEVRSLVGRAVELKVMIDASTGHQRTKSIDELGVVISKLEGMGIELKDVGSGLVDFPASRFGEPVYLCWRLGEKEVEYWHGMTEGFRGRKSLRPELTQVR